ncbi:MAG: Na+/H+ antiporter NhaA, partial [Candidatus Electrothrix sp. AR3]|nr:Na+/H+ antiporter NhaA [Candidatus Electrothrix sp. AR3]
MMDKASKFILEFLRMEALGGILLMLAMVLAILSANTGLAPYYAQFFDKVIAGHTVTTWINDGPMAVFFFLVGLELKREFLEGELADRKKIMLPIFGAIGGMLVPALIYTLLNRGDDLAMQGWAIPTATDIAFTLGVLTLVGSGVPNSLKVFLTSLAIFDDLGAVLIIAFFYTAKISFMALAAAGGCVVILALMNRFHVLAKTPYILVGLLLWVATLKSGIHATLAGVTLALF